MSRQDTLEAIIPLEAALVTSSYRGDFERCRLLCDSIDRHVSNHTRHLILVEGRDLTQFRALAGPKREVVDERELLPRWLRPFPDPSSLGRKRIWLSPYGPPLRGWHVQQLRRLATGAAIDETAMISLDSDVVFLRRFDARTVFEGERVRFYRHPGAVARLGRPTQEEHRAWSRTAGKILGLSTGSINDDGYIATLIAWRRDSVRGLKQRIEAVHGRSWLAVLAGTRSLSECVLYGRYVDEVEERPERHAPTQEELCRMVWSGEALDATDLHALVQNLAPQHVAAGIQSFTGTDPALIRRAVGLN